MYKVKNPAKRLVLLFIIGALVLLLAVPSALASNPVSLSLNGQVVQTNIQVENGVSFISAEALAMIAGVAVSQEGNVPIRQFFEARGGEVSWDAQQRQVVVSWGGAVVDVTDNQVEQTEQGVTRNADELMLRTTELLVEANTYRMQGTALINMNASAAGEALEIPQMELSIAGVYQHQPSAMHMIQTMDISGLLEGLSPEEMAMLGLDSAMITEIVWLNDAIYQKMPGFDQWIVQDLSEMGIMEELNNLTQFTPQQSLEMMQELGIANILGQDAVIDGVEYYTVRNYIDNATFKDIMEELLEGFGLEEIFSAGIPLEGIGIELSEEEQREMQMTINAVLENMEISFAVVTYINKETLMSERMVLDMDIKFSLPDGLLPEGPMNFDMTMKMDLVMYDFGTEIQLPDVSNAVTLVEFLEQMMNMMDEVGVMDEIDEAIQEDIIEEQE